MNVRRWSAIALALGLQSVGCATTSSESTAPPAAAADAPAAAAGSGGDDEASASVGEYHQVHHRGAFANFVALSLETLAPDDSRRAQVEKIQSDLQTKLAPARDAEKAFIQTLADGVAAGTIDPAKVDPAVAAISAASASSMDAIGDSLNQLHALLSPEERSAVAEKVQAHWQVWRQVNHDEAPGAHDPGSRLNRLAEGLGLSPDQVDKMSAALATNMAPLQAKLDPAEMEGHVQTFATAFAGDTFDAKSILAAREANGKVGGHGAQRMAVFFETVTPLLTPDQRTELADHLRGHLTH